MKVPGRFVGSYVTVICVVPPGVTGRRENSGAVQPQEVTTSRITSGLSPRLTPVKVWLTRPSLSRMVPKSQVSGSKTRRACAAAERAANAAIMKSMVRFADIGSVVAGHAKILFLRKIRAIILQE